MDNFPCEADQYELEKEIGKGACGTVRTFATPSQLSIAVCSCFWGANGGDLKTYVGVAGKMYSIGPGGSTEDCGGGQPESPTGESQPARFWQQTTFFRCHCVW